MKVIHFFCKEFKSRNYLSDLWMRVWITDSFAEMGWLEL